MAYDPGALEAALAAAAGTAPDLIDDLRTAFFESAEGHVMALRTAASAEAWCGAAQRLRSLSASFGAVRMIDAARAAEAAACADPKALARIERALAALRTASTG